MSVRIRVLGAFLCALGLLALTVGAIYALGYVLWQADGVAVGTATSQGANPHLAPDGSNGAIITWQENRSDSDLDIYAQRVYSDGTAAWTTDGVSLCVAAHSQINPQIVSDGAGGAIVTWGDHRSGSDYDVYAQSVYSDGTTAWTADGVSLRVAAHSQ